MTVTTGTGKDEALAHIESLPEPRRSQMRRLHSVLLEALPDADVRMWAYGGPMIGYGTYAYSNSKGPAGDWFSVGLASRKNYISLFSMAMADGRHFVETVHHRFPGTKTGKSCINITKPELIEDAAVRDLATETWAQFRDGSLLAMAKGS
jgi:uncharacterized protein DUF1801